MTRSYIHWFIYVDQQMAVSCQLGSKMTGYRHKKYMEKNIVF